MQFDAVDLRILGELQAAARLTNAELAQRVHLSPSPCLARVRTLEQSGVISRYVTLLDPRSVGLNVSVFIQVRLARQIEAALETFEAAIARFEEIMECYLMTGDADYLLRVVVGDLDELQHFIVNKLARIDGVESIKSSIALKNVKYNTAFPLTNAKLK